jgi:hypothetical protein
LLILRHPESCLCSMFLIMRLRLPLRLSMLTINVSGC